MIYTIEMTPNIDSSPKEHRQAKLEKACSEFESIFITHMLKTMRSAVTEDGLLGKSNEGEIIQSMFDENLALGMAKGKGMGIGKMLFESFKG